MRDWISGMKALARRKARDYATIEEAFARMREANPHLSAAQARHLTVWGIRRNEDGTYSWKFDNYTRATSPYLFNLRDAGEIWSRIKCPTLLIRGDESWTVAWEKDGRLGHFRNAEVVTIKRAGHWVHHDQLADFLRVAHRFLDV
jgi:pimeloyl-ACP methyl ester carboxylesterase